MELKFRTQYDRDRIFSIPGDRSKIEYELRYSDQGVEYLEEVGKVDLYEEIQSHRLSVDINYLIKRYEAGDVSALERRQGVYGDFSEMPKTYAEMLNRAIDAENAFDRLPVSVKERFDNSMAQWLSSFGSPEWASKMGLSPSKVVEPVINKVEVNENES